MAKPQTPKTEPPILKKVKELCNQLYYVPHPDLIYAIESKLVGQITPDMVMKAHEELIKPLTKNPAKPTPTPSE